MQDQLSILVTNIFKLYARDFGEIKATQLITKLSEAEITQSALALWYRNRLIPTHRDLQRVVGSINWFVFSKRQTTALGILILLMKWNKEVNQKLGLASEEDTLRIASSITGHYHVYFDETLEAVIASETQTMQIAHHYSSLELINRIRNNISNTNRLEISNIRHLASSNGPGTELQAIEIPPSTLEIQAKPSSMYEDFFKFLPPSIQETFPNYYTETELPVLAKGGMRLRVTQIAKNSSEEIVLKLRSSSRAVDTETGDLISISENAEPIEVSCCFVDSGIFFTCESKGWHILLGGDISGWKYSER
ncbi:hypothetical protein K3G63_15915 [Hymenobacter sp. HSC-4F20]|uniref:hypothetical protein n=1 Tax=Hymenobacter sp. HSC-4F20 TaxID=2864135 RepID=UPI001C73823A|nr:hypothetical protein [Hymenobacter sp. HSC-4F20]MBX0291940.1 hypothetical protein [Hymenobacter sp. HSC-4F20]